MARPGFWPTQFWFYLLPMSGIEMFESPAFWVGAVYVCFPLGLLLYGWNDLGDCETDRLNPRKDSWLFGARPGDVLRGRLPWIIAAVQLPFAIAFIWMAGPKMAIWFLAVLLVNATYNNWGWKGIPVLDIANQVGYLLIFLLASWLCELDQLPAAVWAFSALFAMQSHVFGQLMDIDEDKQAGRRSTAIVLGHRRTKMLLAIMMMIETAIAAAFFQGTVVAIFMAMGSAFFAMDAVFGPPRYPVLFTKAFFVGWNVIVIATMYWVWRDGWFMVQFQA